MTATIRIVHAHDFVKLTPDGWLDRARSMQLLDEIASVAPELTDFHVIMDTRKAQSALTEIDLWFLASELSNQFGDVSQTSRIAVLCPLEHFSQAKFFANCANKRGFNISAFTSFENAYEWLIAEDG